MVPMSPEPVDPSLPSRLREFHERLPLAGDPPNAVLALPDARLLYLVALLRDTPQQPPAMSPADCRPPGDVTAWLDRVFLYAAARSKRAGLACQQHYTSEGRPFIEPRDQGRLSGSTCR